MWTLSCGLRERRNIVGRFGGGEFFWAFVLRRLRARASSLTCATVEGDFEDSVLNMYLALIHNECSEISRKDKFVCFRFQRRFRCQKKRDGGRREPNAPAKPNSKSNDPWRQRGERGTCFDVHCAASFGLPDTRAHESALEI